MLRMSPSPSFRSPGMPWQTTWLIEVQIDLRKAAVVERGGRRTARDDELVADPVERARGHAGAHTRASGVERVGREAPGGTHAVEICWLMDRDPSCVCCHRPSGPGPSSLKCQNAQRRRAAQGRRGCAMRNGAPPRGARCGDDLRGATISVRALCHTGRRGATARAPSDRDARCRVRLGGDLRRRVRLGGDPRRGVRFRGGPICGTCSAGAARDPGRGFIAIARGPWPWDGAGATTGTLRAAINAAAGAPGGGPPPLPGRRRTNAAPAPRRQPASAPPAPP